MNGNPAVSVLMPVYNGERYLREAVESILNQTFTGFEFIIIDDGSADGTWDILQGYDDPRIRLVRSLENIGLIRSLNKGLALARAEYVARMDQDDISLPERFEMQVQYLKAHPEIGVLGTAFQLIDSAGKTYQTLRFPAQHGVLRWSLCFLDPIVHPSVMMRRELVDRAAGYDQNLMAVEDYDLWRRLSSVTRLANMQDVLLRLRKHKRNLSNLRFTEQRNNAIRVSQLMMSEILAEDVPLDVVQRLWNQELESLNDTRQMAKLIYRLCEACAAEGALSTTERRIIRQDAANRLLRLVRLRRDVRLCGVLGLACRLDPLSVGKTATRSLRRVVRECVPSRSPE